MANSIYHIVVRESSPGSFQLFNAISNEIAGWRFRKGTPKVKRGRDTVDLPWPFKDDKWMVHANKEEATKAAKKLQEYLDACEAGRSKTKKKSDDRLEFSETKTATFD